jgi:hypothetical protein
MVATGTKVELVKASGVTGSRLAVPLVSGLPTVSPSSAEIQSGQPPAALRPVAAVVRLILVVAVPEALLSVAVSGRRSRWLPAGPRLVPTAAAVAASACVVGDLVLVAGLLGWTVLAGGVPWPAGLLAAGASSVRLNLADRVVRGCGAARAALG